MLDQQLDIDGNLRDLAPEHETMHLFDSAPQIRGQIALETDVPTPRERVAAIRAVKDANPTEPAAAVARARKTYELRRHCHTVGRDNTRHHICQPGARTALCGRPTRDFNCELGSHVEEALAGEYPDLVCQRCLAKIA